MNGQNLVTLCSFIFVYFLSLPAARHPSNLAQRKENHIEKPLNAFVLYMREMKPIVQAECNLELSAAINQILDWRWHSLSREEQAKYYEKAREERQKYMQLHLNGDARDNYRYHQKKKRKRDKTDDPAVNIKKCRARYSHEQQNLWCKPCSRKKKCIRVQMYLDGATEAEKNEQLDGISRLLFTRSMQLVALILIFLSSYHQTASLTLIIAVVSLADVPSALKSVLKIPFHILSCHRRKNTTHRLTSRRRKCRQSSSHSAKVARENLGKQSQDSKIRKDESREEEDNGADIYTYDEKADTVSDENRDF